MAGEFGEIRLKLVIEQLLFAKSCWCHLAQQSELQLSPVSISVQHSYYLEVLGPTCFCCCGKWEPWDSAWVNCKCRAHTSDPRQRAQSLWCICHPSNPSMATPSVCKGLGLSIATARVAVPVVRRRWKLISSRQSEQLRITRYALIWSFAGGPPWLWMLQIHRHLPL